MDAARKIGTEATVNGKAYANLKELTTIGPRLSGSEGAAKAIAWGKQKLESYGLDRVVLQPAMVPHWTRGDLEEATIVSANKRTPLKVTALGPSVGTPKEGVQAAVVEVHGLDEVEKLGSAVRGKIVFYNRAMTYGGRARGVRTAGLSTSAIGRRGRGPPGSGGRTGPLDDGYAR